MREEARQRAAEEQCKEEERKRENAQGVQVSGNEMTLVLAAGVALEFVRIPAGEFLMGSADAEKEAYADEKPQHRVRLEEYWMGKTPVTVAQFAAFVDASNYRTTAEEKGSGWAWNGSEFLETPLADWQHPRGVKSSAAGKETHPVTQVSWEDARAFCEWVSQKTGRKVRLPSEAEWEKAARGLDGRIYPWGNQSPDAQRCNFNMNVTDTTPVGKYSPLGDSPYGCVDMAGNVWEWTNSLWKGYPYQAGDGREDLKAGGSRVGRGGSFNYNRRRMRSADHSNRNPGNRNFLVGFRVCVSSI